MVWGSGVKSAGLRAKHRLESSRATDKPSALWVVVLDH